MSNNDPFEKPGVEKVGANASFGLLASTIVIGMLLVLTWLGGLVAHWAYRLAVAGWGHGG